MLAAAARRSASVADGVDAVEHLLPGRASRVDGGDVVRAHPQRSTSGVLTDPAIPTTVRVSPLAGGHAARLPAAGG